MVQSVDVSDPGLLAVGPHTVTFAVQSGALSGGGYYVADLDVYDEVAETSKADNESAPLAGVFQASDGSVYVFTSSTGTSRYRERGQRHGQREPQRNGQLGPVSFPKRVLCLCNNLSDGRHRQRRSGGASAVYGVRWSDQRHRARGVLSFRGDSPRRRSSTSRPPSTRFTAALAA